MPADPPAPPVLSRTRSVVTSTDSKSNSTSGSAKRPPAKARPTKDADSDSDSTDSDSESGANPGKGEPPAIPELLLKSEEARKGAFALFGLLQDYANWIEETDELHAFCSDASADVHVGIMSRLHAVDKAAREQKRQVTSTSGPAAAAAAAASSS